MQSRSVLINTNENWSDKRRYKINNVVNYAGGVYQNSTGGNSDPSTGIDWVFIKSVSSVPVAYHEDFTADVTQIFEVPLGIVIKNVFLNNVSANGSDWSQTGIEVTVTSSQVGDLVTLTN